jgi:hypothetical protein
MKESNIKLSTRRREDAINRKNEERGKSMWRLFVVTRTLRVLFHLNKRRD